ncbi:MAG: AAA family ATPase, partial [Candidatus Norongarragalinales archaeon]
MEELKLGKRYSRKPSSAYARHVKKVAKPGRAKLKLKTRLKTKPKIKAKPKRIEKRKVTPQPKPTPSEAPPKPPVAQTPKTEPKPEPPLPQPPKPSEPQIIEPPRATGTLTDAERRRAMLVPVPDKGPVPTPYVDWEKIPKSCIVKDVVYLDYPSPHAPEGMLKELREMFRRNRLYQNKAPVNIMIWGPKGTGKSELVKKFTEDTGLPYWQVMGQEGLRAEELLGHW